MEDQTVKIAVVTQATFIETCANGLTDLSKANVGHAGLVHLQSVGAMLKQCAQSLRSFAGAYKSTASPPEDDSLFPPHDKEPEYAIRDEAYLSTPQERELAMLFGLIDNEDGNGQAAVENAEGQLS